MVHKIITTNIIINITVLVMSNNVVLLLKVSLNYTYNCTFNPNISII